MEEHWVYAKLTSPAECGDVEADQVHGTRDAIHGCHVIQQRPCCFFYESCCILFDTCDLLYSEKHGNIIKRNTANTAVKVLGKSNIGVFQEEFTPEVKDQTTHTWVNVKVLQTSDRNIFSHPHKYNSKAPKPCLYKNKQTRKST